MACKSCGAPLKTWLKECEYCGGENPAHRSAPQPAQTYQFQMSPLAQQMVNQQSHFLLQSGMAHQSSGLSGLGGIANILGGGLFR